MSILGNTAIRHVHCVGIGGIGVSAIAEILLKRGYVVSGSDSAASERLSYLESLGATIHVGHDASHVTGADVLVYTSAVDAGNPELQYAATHGVMLVKRGHMLADIMQFYRSVAIAGTHGKTTTTGMLAHVCTEAGLDPTYFIGGIPHAKSSPVHIGDDDICIAEADESDASFLYMQPQYAVVTNIECDHMSTYAGSEEELCQSFLMFLKHIPLDGLAVLCADDSNIEKIRCQLSGQTVFYGVSPSADYCIQDFQQSGLAATARVTTPTGDVVLTLQVPGLYNMKNAVAAMILANALGVEQDRVITALSTFQGVARRFDRLGRVTIGQRSLTVYEDYGHHPTEVRETYAAAKTAFPTQQVILIFQPHRYTRTRDLMDEFIDVFGAVDQLVLLPTYAASEAVIEEATSQALACVLEHEQVPVTYLPDMSALPALLGTIAQSDDVVMFQGAGDVSSLAKAFVANYE